MININFLIRKGLFTRYNKPQFELPFMIIVFFLNPQNRHFFKLVPKGQRYLLFIYKLVTFKQHLFQELFLSTRMFVAFSQWCNCFSLKFCTAHILSNFLLYTSKINNVFFFFFFNISIISQITCQIIIQGAKLFHNLTYQQDTRINLLINLNSQKSTVFLNPNPKISLLTSLFTQRQRFFPSITTS